MPDFTARIVASTVAFVDDVSPPRLNPAVGHPHRFIQVPIAAASLQARATVAGVEAPADAALGGRLFTWWWVQTPGYPTARPPIQHLAGKTSEIDLVGWPNGDALAAGLWVLGVSRPDGGGVLLTFNVEA